MEEWFVFASWGDGGASREESVVNRYFYVYFRETRVVGGLLETFSSIASAGREEYGEWKDALASKATMIGHKTN